MATPEITQLLDRQRPRKCGSNALPTEVSPFLSSGCSLPWLRKSDGSQWERLRLFASIASAYFHALWRTAEGRRIKKTNNLIIFFFLTSAFWGFSEGCA